MTHETEEQIASFVEDYEPVYPILCQGGGQLHAYSTGGVPTAVWAVAGTTTHADFEYVDLDRLAPACRMHLLTALKYLGGED